MEHSFSRLFVLWFSGTNGRGSFHSTDHSFTGTFIPNYKKVVKLVYLL